MDRRAVLTRNLAILTAVGMFIVLLMGAGVTATGSGTGCGNDWPLCSGRLIPQDTFHSIVEYSHRIVTGMESFLVLGTALLGWGLRKRYPDFKILIPAMCFTLVLQALMGAAAVKWPTSAGVMATHFGISLICLASAALIARILFDNGRHRDGRLTGLEPPPGIRFLMVASFIASILVAYGGAYVRHSHSELACGVQWPLCNGSAVPDMGNNAGINFGHRLSAIAIALLIGALVWVTYKHRIERPDYFMVARAALVVVILQSFAGAMVVLSTVQAATTLLHAALMAALFVILADGVVRVLPSRATSESMLQSPLSRRPITASQGD